MGYNFESYERKEKVNKIVREIIIWTVELLLVIGAAYFIIHYAVEKTTMVGESMEPILLNEDEIVINKFAYRFTDPKRFDIIVFKQSGKEHSFYNIKRIIGLPGETVSINDGVVLINGAPLKEKITVETMTTAGVAEEKIKLDENEYFVLGDNRNNSEDSRFASLGNVVKEDIIGKAWIRLDPFNFINQLTTEERYDKEERELEEQKQE